MAEIIGDTSPYRLQQFLYRSPWEADEVRDDLRDVADRIDRVQDRNRTLIGHSLDHIHLFLSVLSGVDPEAKSYSCHGDIKNENRPAVLDRRM